MISGCVLRCGGVHAFVEDATATDRPVQMRGLLYEDHHGAIPDEIPPTRGTVRRIQVVTRPYVRVGPRDWIARDGEAELRDVTRSPERFDRNEVLQAGLRMSEAGLLVTLEVDDASTEH